ncbi:ARM repeat-containing protein [Laetiporus sulphureus 93-53]|uniref:Importin-13 n=1 Tax=Laetiporus sulphureus 93-53 TaxID=1314785 RepID=A0A165BX52_9APHY|nr:ARM repeat-containing protein [Laetiporus sulphureus 93-53]KZT01812.1 ARM repeat-containing protein [Laetiporus sulphureus 93-53]
MSAVLPVLSQDDVDRAAQLIQQAYAPLNNVSPGDQRLLQQELFDIQKRPEAWGLVIPFLQHADPNVQFFGAHTAQVKIARDWESFPPDRVLGLRDTLVDLTGRAIVAGRSKVILRKLFVAITSLALKICPGSNSQWPDWLISSVNTMLALGASNEHLLDFLAIAAEEVESADLLTPNKSQMQRTLLDTVPMVVQAIIACITLPEARNSPKQLASALKCIQAWLSILPGSDLTPLIPLLIALLSPISTQTSPLEFDDDIFGVASETLQEIMARSSLSDGSGSHTLTEPLLLWFNHYGGQIVQDTLSAGFVDTVSHSFCQLLVAVGDHSTLYLAANIASPNLPAPLPPPPSPISFPAPATPTKSHLVQNFLRLIMAYTGLPGYYAADEEESELTLGFWYLFQEALWNAEYEQEFEGSDINADVVDSGKDKDEQAELRVAKAVYRELVEVLRRKVTWPEIPQLRSWPRDQRDKFQAYRRDVGDTLINAYYILRSDLLAYYVNDISERLSSKQAQQGWEEIEATLHCVMTVQEAVPLEDNPHLRRLFGPDILGRLPVTGRDRVRRTTLLLIGSYSSWFTTQPDRSSSSLLMNAISYVVAALSEPSLCLPAANALRDLCDANRTYLAPHIAAFGELHARIAGIPDSEKSKVLQSIASVIQALPPEEAIPPVEAIVNPIVSKLFATLESSPQLPDEARLLIMQQLQTISGVAQGLTRTPDSLLILDESPDTQEEAKRMRLARDDPRMVKMRETILDAIRRTMQLWSTDAAISDALSSLFKAITALPSDITILSLPPMPLLELVCMAAQRQLTAVWLSLATMLIALLDPQSLIPTTFKSVPDGEASQAVVNVLNVLLHTTFSMLGQPGAMEENPDIVQGFFYCMNTVAQHFVATFYQLPPELFNALMQCAITSLALQERYSLVAACTFLVTLTNRTCSLDELSEAKQMIAQTHGRSIMKALLNDFAGAAPRSATQNLIELLSALVMRFPAESKVWMTEILHHDEFADSKANSQAKDKFIKAVLGSRNMKRIREAAQQFSLIARGLADSSFGYASVTM